jgi:integrase/recombinase XerD
LVHFLRFSDRLFPPIVSGEPSWQLGQQQSQKADLMKQAKVLNDREFKRVIAAIAAMKHAVRNRAALMLSFYGGLRVGEIAALRMADVIDSRGEVKELVLLRASTTKSGEARTVFLNDKLRGELTRYVAGLEYRDGDAPFLLTQKKTAFTANSLCQLFSDIYKLAGMDGASSHSGRRWFITRLAHAGCRPKSS